VQFAAGPACEVKEVGKLSELDRMVPLFRKGLGYDFTDKNNRCSRENGKTSSILDIGANIGYYSLFFASFGCNVRSYDPVEFNHNYHLASSRLNGFQELLNINLKGLADKPGRLKMKSSKQESGESFIPTNTEHTLNPIISDVHELEVDVETLDTNTSPSSIISLLKMDVEGYEPYVLLGASSLLKRRQILSLVIEISGHSQSLDDLRIIRQVFDDSGYVPVMSVHGTFDWDAVISGWSKQSRHEGVLFVPKN
jgi:FkbM family methyltransferase